MTMFRSRKRDPDDDPIPEGIDEEMLVIVDRQVNPYLVMFHDPSGFRAEQIRSLRNKLMAMNPDGGPKTLVVSSAVRGEGKSVTAINLALAFAELDQQVVLVDADLRGPAVNRYLHLSDDVGLADVLSGRARLDQVIRQGEVRRLDILSAGTSVGRPSDYLSSVRIAELYDRLKGRYQYVVVDSPPVLTASDTGLLASESDGVLMVVRLEHSTKSHSKDAVRALTDLGANVMGTFVTEVRGADPDADRRLLYDDGGDF